MPEIVFDQLRGTCKKEKREVSPNEKSDNVACRDLNQGPFAYRANALPAELQVTVRAEWSLNPTIDGESAFDKVSSKLHLSRIVTCRSVGGAFARLANCKGPRFELVFMYVLASLPAFVSLPSKVLDQL